MALLFGKKNKWENEEVFFPARRFAKDNESHILKEELSSHFKEPGLTDIMEIPIDKEVGLMVQNIGPRLEKKIDLVYSAGYLYYKREDEKSVYFLIKKTTEDNASRKEEKQKIEEAELRQRIIGSEPPTEEENKWAGIKMAEELMAIEAEEEIKVEENIEAKPRKKRVGAGFTNQIKTRLTDEQLEKFEERVIKSGLSQSEFVRRAVLQNKIVIKERSPVEVALLDEVSLLRADLGRQGGLLKMIIKPNEGRRELVPDEWNELISAVRDIEKLTNRIAKLEVAILHGNLKAQDE